MDLDITSLPEGITILTGGRGSGKTRTCLNWMEQARQIGWTVAGLVCPAVFQNSDKSGIDMVDISTNRIYRLANAVTRITGEIFTDHWDFDTNVLSMGNEILAGIKKCDLLIIDELGPLEFYRHQGWTNAFPLLEKQLFTRAVVVIRPELLEEAGRLWPAAVIIRVE